ncbi:MAG: biotin transporter BioY [Ruminiclostridium sp.]|nr:biotin transporter BioY [Ruminiclostridium sp.]
METKNTRSKTLMTVTCALFAAIIAVSAQVQIPLFTMVPITLHTFGVALCAAIGGSVSGAVSTAVYVLIGAVGVPVFAGMKGGFSVLLGPTGGFLFGFIIMAFFCGIQAKNIWQRIGFSLIGLAVCYLCGALQYAIIMQKDFITSLTLVVVPFIVKDVLSIAAAQYMAVPIKRGIAHFSNRNGV